MLAGLRTCRSWRLQTAECPSGLGHISHISDAVRYILTLVRYTARTQQHVFGFTSGKCRRREMDSHICQQPWRGQRGWQGCSRSAFRAQVRINPEASLNGSTDQAQSALDACSSCKCACLLHHNRVRERLWSVHRLTFSFELLLTVHRRLPAILHSTLPARLFELPNCLARLVRYVHTLRVRSARWHTRRPLWPDNTNMYRRDTAAPVHLYGLTVPRVLSVLSGSGSAAGHFDGFDQHSHLDYCTEVL